MESLLIFVSLLTLWINVLASSPSIVMTMICRDEEVNLKTNLQKWLSIVDYYVFLIDNRTTDNTVSTIQQVLSKSGKKYKIIGNEFKGFGSSRSLSLVEAWKNYPFATHVLIADPDWIPDISTINKNDLQIDSDVYRFTVFDRSGFTKRRMDWLLKHREGLAMRYNLHEVLDIGRYTRVHQLDWVMHEVEKSGSWHTTVGHGNSMSTKRWEFDLELLEKDLAELGHDPHTHYYLGVTNQAIASANHEAGLARSPETEKYLQDALRYLELRLRSQYEDEFADERWACMYLLGITYANVQRDVARSVHWLSMCRDYNPKQSECGIALAKVQLANGIFDLAVKEAEAVLRNGNVEREYLSHFRNWACEMPMLMVELLGQKARQGVLTGQEAKYLLLMVHMTREKVCEGKVAVLPGDVTRTMRELLRAESSGSRNEKRVTIESSAEELCVDAGLVQFLIHSKFQLHPCEDFRQQLEASQRCQLFTFNLPAANEETQANTAAKEFVGAALLPDIIHQVFGGDARKVFDSGRPYRLLFAEHFNPKIVHNIVGFFARTSFTNYQIHVVSSEPATLAALEETITFCGKHLGLVHTPTITYQHSDLLQYLESAASELKRDPVSSAAVHQFDYVEYNCGLSISSDGPQHLSLIAQLLVPEGVVGVTYFTRNHHVDKVKQFIASKDATALPPFSLETSRMIASYLDLHKMGFLKEDRLLLTFLGAEPASRNNPPKRIADVAPSVQWTAFTRAEVVTVLTVVGLKAVAWMPSAYAQPYERIQHYEVQRFRAMGMSEEHFLQKYLTHFRYSLYVQRRDAASLGRAVISPTILNTPMAARNVLVIDRLGSLSASFEGVQQRAQKGMSTSFAFAPYAFAGHFSLSYVALPQVAPCLQQLSSGASVWQLHQENVAFARKHQLPVDEPFQAELLLNLLAYLESVNAVSFLSDRAPVTTVYTASANKRDVQQLSRHPEEHAAERVTVKQGGLTITFKKPKASAAAPANAKFDKSTGQQPTGEQYRRSEMPHTEATTITTTATTATTSTTSTTSTKNSSTIQSAGSPNGGAASETTSTGGGTKTKKVGGLNITFKSRAPSEPTASPTVDAAVQGGGNVDSAVPSEIENKVARMRQLGFSEKMIEDALFQSSSVARSTHSSATSPAATATVLKEQDSSTKNERKGELSGAGTAKSAPLSRETQAARMRALGFSEEMIEASLLADASSANSKKQNTTPHLVKTKAAPSSLDATGNSVKGKLRDILEILKEEGDGSSAARDSAAGDSKSGSTSVLSVGNVAGGLLRPKVHVRGKEASSAAKKAEEVQQPEVRMKGIGKDASSAPFSHPDTAKVQLPAAVQSRLALAASFRRPECYQLSRGQSRNQIPPSCAQAMPLKRRTAALSTVSLSKVVFDAEQLRYLSFLGLSEDQETLRLLLGEHQKVREHLVSKEWTDRYRVVRLVSEEVATSSAYSLNRAVHVADDRCDPSDLLHKGAVQHLQSVALTSLKDNDFVVVDVLLRETAMRHFSAALLASTVWFDCTNGISFVSHFDDGLVLETAAHLAQQVAFALSSGSQKLRVVKYFAVAMSLDKTGGSSAVAMANRDEMAVILWLNPASARPDAEKQEDGLRIFDDFAAGRLFAQGVSVYPSVHPDFLSKSGDLHIDIAAKCNTTNSELVPRKPNRMVVVKERRPFVFSVPPSASRAAPSSESDPQNFERNTMVAMVVVLSAAR